MDKQDVQEFHCVHGALIKNERLKLYKKPSTWVIMGIVVGLILLGLVLSQAFSSNEQNYTSSKMWLQEYDNQLGHYKVQLKENPNQPELKSSVDRLTYLIDNQIPPTDWRIDAAEEYFNLKYGIAIQSAPSMDGKYSGITVNVPENIQTPSMQNNSIDSAKANQQMEKLKKILDENDWKSYIRLRIEDLESGAIISANESEKKVDIEICNLYLDNNIIPSSSSMSHGTTDTSGDMWKSAQIQAIRNYKLNLLRGENMQGSLLTNSQRNEYQKNINIAVERLRTNTKPVESSTFLGLLESSSSSLGLFSVILIVLASINIASEYGTGTIKLLLITPHKRQKIFWAKVLVILEVSAIALCSLFVLTFLISGAFTGFKGIGDMQVLSLFGKIVHIPYLVYIVLVYLLMMLPVLTYGALALMLSAVTRKSAVAISITFALMLGSDIIMSILRMISSRMVVPGIKFLLFANTSLSSYLPKASPEAVMFNQNLDNTMTLGFSVAVLLVYTACFLWVARDSFCRRDVR